MSEIKNGRLDIYGTKHSKCNHMITLGFKRLRRCLKTSSDGADVTWGRRSFRLLLTPETAGKDRLPNVEGRTHYTDS